MKLSFKITVKPASHSLTRKVGFEQKSFSRFFTTKNICRESSTLPKTQQRMLKIQTGPAAFICT